MRSAVAIINWNSENRLHACIESLMANAAGTHILVIDNASSDASLECVERFRNEIEFVRNSVNRGFAAAVNQAFLATQAPYVLILNPDVRALPGAVWALEHFLETHPRAGAAGGYVNEKYGPRKLPTVYTLIRENLGLKRAQTPSDHSRKTRAPGSPVRSADAIAVDQPAASALMIRRDAYNDVAGFDERFYPAWYEDVDFCCRLKAAGWELYFLPAAEFMHEGGYSTAALGFTEFVQTYYSNQVRYAHKHFGKLGSAAVRASIALGMAARMVSRPKQASAYGWVLLGALKGWPETRDRR